MKTTVSIAIADEEGNPKVKIEGALDIPEPVVQLQEGNTYGLSNWIFNNVLQAMKPVSIPPPPRSYQPRKEIVTKGGRNAEKE